MSMRQYMGYGVSSITFIVVAWLNVYFSSLYQLELSWTWLWIWFFGILFDFIIMDFLATFL